MLDVVLLETTAFRFDPREIGKTAFRLTFPGRPPIDLAFEVRRARVQFLRSGRIVFALDIAGIERHDPGAPASVAFRSALARKGREIAAAGGPVALADMPARVRAADAPRADARETVVAAAWAGLPGRETAT